MNIVERLNSFLEQFGITKSQFADNCDIPRPTASQILSGRNKKISDDIISKIHNIYPELSISWLLFGEGEMFVSINSVPSSKPSEIPLFLDAPNILSKESKEKELKTPAMAGNQVLDKEITKIVVFYSDNSFEEFYKNIKL